MTIEKDKESPDLDESWNKFTRRFGIKAKPRVLDNSREAASLEVQRSSGPHRGTWVQWGVCAGGIAAFLLFFHVVPTHTAVFPKASPSFANTFVDLDEYLTQYNTGSYIDRLAMRQTYLFQQLKAKGLVFEKTEQEQK